MDLLRAALGDRQLTYLGFSYGSMLGQNYANLFPSRVRALVIDGVLDPIAWTTGRGDEARTTPLGTRLGSADGAQRTLGEFFRLCDAAGPDCAFSGNASAAVRGPGRAAARAPGRHHRPVHRRDVHCDLQRPDRRDAGRAVRARSSGRTWPSSSPTWSSRARRPRWGSAWRAIRAELGLAAAAQEEYPNFVEAVPGRRLLRQHQPAVLRGVAGGRGQRRSAGTATSAGSGTGAGAPAGRGRAPPGRTGTWARGPRAPSSPVLVVGNYFDPATRYQGAVDGVAAAAQLAAAVLRRLGAHRLPSRRQLLRRQSRHPIPADQPGAPGGHRVPARGLAVRSGSAANGEGPGRDRSDRRGRSGGRPPRAARRLSRRFSGRACSGRAPVA